MVATNIPKHNVGCIGPQTPFPTRGVCAGCDYEADAEVGWTKAPPAPRAEISVQELITLANAIEPLVNAYKNDAMTKEERVFLESVGEVLAPVIVEYLAIMWKDLEPILLRLELWPPKEEKGE